MAAHRGVVDMPVDVAVSDEPLTRYGEPDSTILVAAGRQSELAASCGPAASVTMILSRGPQCDATAQLLHDRPRLTHAIATGEQRDRPACLRLRRILCRVRRRAPKSGAGLVRARRRAVGSVVAAERPACGSPAVRRCGVAAGRPRGDIVSIRAVHA